MQKEGEKEQLSIWERGYIEIENRHKKPVVEMRPALLKVTAVRL